jgi:hypothetical protein
MDIGGGWRPVYKGTGDSVLVTGLTASTAYRIVVFEYDGQGGGEAYLTTVGTNALNKSTISSFATWTSGTVRSLLDKNFWTYPSAGIGADGYTYVVHFDYDSDTETAKRVVVSRWNGTAWSTHASFTASDAGLSGLSDYLSIAVDASNTVHIAFMGYTGSGVTSTRGVAYARYNGSWLFESVEMNSHPSGWLNTSKPFIAVDASSVPHIAYDLVDASVHQQHSKLATRTGASTWSKTTWKSNPSNSNENVKEWRLKADANGKLHLVYILNLISGDDELHYYTNASGSWVDATLASSSFTMYDAYLGLDSNNKAHATYSTGSTTYDSYYLTNKSGSWVSTLLSANSTNYPQGVLINSSNEIVIPTGDGTTQRLFYLDAGSSEWQLSNPSTADADRESVPAATFSNDGKVVLVYANNLSSRPRKLSYFQAVIP